MKLRMLPIALSLSAMTLTAPAMAATPLTVFAAGTLAVPFKAINAAFQQKYPDAAVQAQFGGSVKMAKQVAVLHLPCDVIAVADYNVIPKYLFGANGKPEYANWYAGFVGNAITFVYTDNSKFAGQVNSSNWFKYLSQPGVQIGRSNPDTDPSGYQTVQMLNLANQYYKDPSIESKVLANAPVNNMRDTETTLISALQVGQLDYLAIYKSDALQHHFKYIDLPTRINLSSPADAGYYKNGVAHTKNGDLTGKPIVYAITVLNNAAHKDLADKYVQFILSPEGQAIMARDGFVPVKPAAVVNPQNVPATIKPLVKPWPKTGA